VLEDATDDGPLVEATYLAWYGVLNMPKINLSNPETRQYFLDVTQYWLREFDVDGWRMDVARHVVPDFWDDFRRAAKAAKPDCYLLAEIWGNTSPWLQGTQFDATMNYFFRDLVVDYFARQSMDTPAFMQGVNHMLALYAPQVTHCTHNLFSSHDVTRLRFEAGEDLSRLRLATLFQLTIPGAAGIYYGDEIGMSGGEDPDNRRAFPWDRPESWDQETLALTRALVRLRREHPALRLGEYRPVWQDGDAFAFERVVADERVLVMINRGAARDSLSLPVVADRAEVLFGDAQVHPGAEDLGVLGLGAHAGLVLQLDGAA
jgi:glycosidase